MCAQKIDSYTLRKLNSTLESFIAPYNEHRKDRERIEREYLEGTEETFNSMLQADIYFITKIEDALRESQNLLQDSKLLETQKIVESLSPGQPRTYGYVLKAYLREPRFYSTYEIIKINKLEKNRSTVQRLLGGKTDKSVDSQRGNKTIRKILRIEKSYKGRKETNYYKPVGFLASVVELIS